MFLRKIPYQSVRRRLIRHWPLLLAAGAGDRAPRPRVRAAVPARRRPGGGREREPRGGHPARPLRQHGLRRSLRTGAPGRARASCRAWAPNDRASLVLFATEVEVAVQPTGRARAAARRHRRGSPGPAGHALRAGAAGRGRPARVLADAAARARAHHRLPEGGVGRRRAGQAGAGHRPDHRAGGRVARRGRRGRGPRLSTRGRGPGWRRADHRQRARRQPRRFTGGRAARSCSRPMGAGSMPERCPSIPGATASVSFRAADVAGRTVSSASSRGWRPTS